MNKIAFMGAGSTGFAKRILGDCIVTPAIEDMHIALYDIDPVRLEDSRMMLENILHNSGRRDVTVVATMDRIEALRDARFVINVIQVGGYKPCTVTDFEIPKKYGLRQTIADTLGVGGIFRAMRTIPVLEDFARDMEKVCPNALLINYTNPLAMVAGYMQRYTGINTVGLCHSVQFVAQELLEEVGLKEYVGKTRWKAAGINHQSWLLTIEDMDGNDLYPEIKRRSMLMRDGKMEPGDHFFKDDLVRHEMMHQFGYFVTESSEHTSEYTPWFIKNAHPELIERYRIPLDEYPRRCEEQIKDWEKMRNDIVLNTNLMHEKSYEFAVFMMEAMITDVPTRVYGNVQNTGLIPNLPREACVEVPCMIDRNGVNPCYVGNLPEQCASVNRTNVNVQLCAIEGMHKRKKSYIYQAALLDPHTSSELTIDEIRSMVDDLFEAHRDWLPEYSD